MSRAIMKSVHPDLCETIAIGKCTILLSKTRPKIDAPFKCYIYATNRGRPLVYAEPTAYHTEPILHRTYGWNRKMADKIFGIWNSKVIGEFVCDWIAEINPHCDIKDYVNQYIFGYPAILCENDCLSFEEMKSYLGNNKGYAWHISDLKIYYEPKELWEFSSYGCKIVGDCCINYDCPNCIDNGWMQPPDCKIDGCYLTRPPQSWCYVEESVEF